MKFFNVFYLVVASAILFLGSNAEDEAWNYGSGYVEQLRGQNRDLDRLRWLSTSRQLSKGTRAPSTKSTKAPSTKSTKAPSTKSTKAPSTKSTKAPGTKSTKAPSTKSTKAPSTKSTKAPSASSKGKGTDRYLFTW